LYTKKKNLKVVSNLEVYWQITAILINGSYRVFLHPLANGFEPFYKGGA